MDISKKNGANLDRDRNLIITYYEGNKALFNRKKGYVYYVEMELDPRDLREGEIQRNINLRSWYDEKTQRYKKTIALNSYEFDLIAVTAVENTYSGVTSNKGKEFIQFAVKGDLMRAKDGHGLTLDPRTIKKSDFIMDEDAHNYYLDYKFEQNLIKQKEFDSKAKAANNEMDDYYNQLYGKPIDLESEKDDGLEL